ncbi:MULTISPECIES: cellulose-binding protein [Streptomyces]|jgi:cell division septum initiation protein DivIVA|uniref:cellulose-binding protein n=1 Tax=Streptomyces TaxID=1883 RepID=UPI000FFEEB54|nr:MULTISPECIES: cellulose-binding protein [Streptomyces]MBY8344845.1 cellulose-binding protein [Streptomyces plumbidurans]
MRGTPVLPHGFGGLRGRGYCPEQVEALAEALAQDRDAAWERAARLTVLARDMEVEAELLQEHVAQLAPQSYETLGEGARRLFQSALEEAEAVRERARQEARRLHEEAEEHADGVREAAQAHADTVRAEAEDRARHRLLAAQAEADEIRVDARRAVKEGRGEALTALREVRRRTAAMLTEQAAECARRWAEVEQLESDRFAGRDALGAERTARAEAELAAAEREFAQAEEFDRRSQEEARERAAEILAAARSRAEQIARETELVLREHEERSGGVQAEMDVVRNSLTALTGSASGE